MKITQDTLRNIIKEEISKVVLEEGMKTKLAGLGLAALLGIAGKIGADFRKEAKKAIAKMEDESEKKRKVMNLILKNDQVSSEDLKKILGDDKKKD